jgi:ATP-dependent helicase/nuclease subunit B
MLARRVATELARFDLPADDSGGMPLADTVPGSFMLRLAGLLAADCTVIGMLAVFKHPLFRLGLDRPAARRLVERFELLVLRGRKGRPDPSHLAGEVEAALQHHMDEQTHSRVLEAFSAREIAAITAFAARFDAASAPLFAGPHTRTLSSWLDALVTCAEACATLDAAEIGDTETDFGPLYAGDSGEALAQIMTSLIDAGADYDVPREELAAVLAALFTGEAVKPQRGRHPRVFIWGTLEARLLTVDTMVLGGLNEGVWPPAPETGAFLSRLMRREIRLSPPERRIGQVAHDFEQALGIRHVVMTRALKAEGAPSEPSRWLQRLLAVAGPDGAASLRKAGQASLDIARRLDLAPSQPFVTRPAPTPPAALRPTHFSVTEIETLRQDPYAVFARRILRLRPLPELIRDPDARERGTLFHAILAEATRNGLDWAAPDAKARFAALARTLFDAKQLEPDIEALWWPRFVALIPELADFESRRQALAATRLAEVISGKVPVGATGVTVAAVADRVDILNAGGVMILDYKTGSSPSKSDAQKLRSVQVALEAALAARGGFAETGTHGVHEVMFLRLGARGSATPEQIAPQTISHPDKSKTELTPEAFGDRAWQRLERLLYHFNTETNGYVSRANPLWQARYDQPYDHLARVLEWSAGGSEGEDGGDAGSDAA